MEVPSGEVILYTAIIPAVIALVGVATSNILASKTAKNRSIKEIKIYNANIYNANKNNIFDYIQSHSDHILEKRIDVYPIIYQIVSSLIKSIREEYIDLEIIKNSLINTDKWDSEFSLFLGSISVENMDKYRKILIHMKSSNESLTRKNIDKLYRASASLELSLKQELQIFNIESLYPQDSINHYRNIQDSIRKSHKTINEHKKI